jgi:hypothetical protein
MGTGKDYFSLYVDAKIKEIVARIHLPVIIKERQSATSFTQINGAKTTPHKDAERLGACPFFSATTKATTAITSWRKIKGKNVVKNSITTQITAY